MRNKAAEEKLVTYKRLYATTRYMAGRIQEAAIKPIGEQTEYDLLSGELLRLNRMSERVHARYTATQADGVERAAYLLLATLVTQGPRRLSVLAEDVHSDASTVSRQIAQLVGLGLVERRPDATDGRASLLAATEAGQRTFECKRQGRNEKYAALLASWSADDRRQFTELLARFNDDYEDYFLAPAPERTSHHAPAAEGIVR